MSDARGGTSSSRSSTSAEHTLQKRRSQSARQDNVLERHRHWSTTGVKGSGALRAGARESRPQYDYARILRPRAGRRRDEQGIGGRQEEEGIREEVPDPPDNDEEGGEAPEAEDEDEEQDADRSDVDPRYDIQARLRLSPNVIVADTWANRPQRTRTTIDKYQAGTRTPTKKPGRGRGR